MSATSKRKGWTITVAPDPVPPADGAGGAS